ncbi:MAG: TlpA family protein disulfide reductase [Limisphaerales bacterium]|jgi:thiol-disulfide isomerase/thioredoxin|nr:TlpA disulfide reductase family protein [Verrucomicrobiota bacterium]
MKKLHSLASMLFALALPALVLFSAGCTGGEPLQNNGKAKELTISQWVKGEPADVTDGEHIYVVEFWATWCGPCLQSIPHLTELQKKYKDQGVLFIGVTAEKAEVVEPFVAEQGDKMDYIVALDKNNATNKDYMTAHGQRGIPCAFLIDKEGYIVWIGHPMMLEAQLKQILAQ